MSLPIPPTGIVGAIRLATRAIETVGQSLDFDQVLRAPESESLAGTAAANDPDKVRTAWLKVVERIRTLLSGANLQSDAPITLEVHPEGRLRVAGSHRSAAAIESALSGDRQLDDMIARMIRLGGPSTLTIPAADRPT